MDDDNVHHRIQNLRIDEGSMSGIKRLEKKIVYGVLQSEVVAE